VNLQRFINLTYRDIGVIYSGQTPSTDQSNDALDTINEILGNWSQEGLLVPTHAVTSFALTAATAGYTMGVGGTWVTSDLPIKVKGALSSLTGFQQGLEVVPMGEFEASIANAIGATATLPTRMGIDNAAPLRNVRLWPTPNSSSAVVEVSYWMPLTAFVALTDTVAFALPAFELALRNEAGLRLANMHKCPVTQDMLLAAQASKTALMRIDPTEPPAQAAQPSPQQAAR
jgi:hypothetical protein